MGTPRLQYDELLGGMEQLPSTVSLIHFANARSQEINALTEAIEEPQNTHLLFQRLPKHLRRRAMSHNVKRMPLRLQEAHLSQMEKSGLPVKGKRPSRKFRRKPSNLLDAYNRRQRHAAWLETHVWHAKRFHMVEQWGYKLPDYPNDKGFRACYRATAKHCLLQDVSYLCCIELRGSEANILEHLNQLTNPECGLTFAATSTLNGNREGSVMVFKKGTYPFHAIGKVSFVWRPREEDTNRTIWIWSHPAFYSELLEELIAVFQFEPDECTKMDVDSVDHVDEANREAKASPKSGRNVEKMKLETKNIGKLPKYSNQKVEMTLLKDTLNRFRLTGPLAQVVLTEALKFVDLKAISEFRTAMETEDSEQPRSAWLTDFYNEEARLAALKKQKLFWIKILPLVNSADELPPRMVLSATVVDPRLTMPTSRIKAINKGEIAAQPVIPEGICSHSALWETSVRDSVTNSKMASAQLNNLRSRALVPGLSPPAWIGNHNVSFLPLLLIQNPSAKGDRLCGGYGSGWDVIVPAGWGVPLWMGLVFRGARAGGLRETERLTLETASGPVLPPDTQAGCKRSEQCYKNKMDKHFRLPPDKRPNYTKLGIVSPFLCPWKRLLQDWNPEEKTDDVYVIRNRAQIDHLRNLLNRTKSNEPSTFTECDKTYGLVLVGVEMCGRGTLGECSLICSLGKKDSKLTRGTSGRGPVEPLHEDANEESRKTLREAHLAKLKRLRKKRVRAKREMEENDVFIPKEKVKKPPTEELVKQQAEVMKELWLPSEIKSVKNSSSRCVMGFVTFGDFSFTQSKSFGYGYVSLSALLSALGKNQSHFLVRNVSSLQYQIVTLKLINPV